MTPNPWTPEETDYLKTQRALNVPFSKIAAHLKRTIGSIAGKADRVDCPLIGRNPPPPSKPRSPKPRKPQPPSHVPATEQAPGALYLNLLDLAPHQCVYPHGDGPFLHCGAHAPNYPYCEFHSKLAYRKAW